MYTTKELALKRKDAGFGLVELIVVVAIMAVLIVIAVPVYGAIQSTANQNAVNEAARSTYGSVMSVYKSKGRDAAVQLVTKLNSDSPWAYYVRETRIDPDGTMVNSDQFPRTRSFFEDAVKTPNGLPFAELKASIKDTILTEDIGSVATTTAGDFLCVGVISGKVKVEYAGWAGQACGPASTN